MRISILKPTKQKTKIPDIFGFDIETYGRENKFYCASIWHKNPNFCKTFYDKEELINHLKQKRFYSSFIACTNLSFDFFGTFFDHKTLQKFKFLERGSFLLSATTYIKNKEFSSETTKHKISFIDTLNYASLSVEKLGKLIGIEKFEKPSFLGKKPKDKEEKRILEEYNMQDSKVSALGLEFLLKAFIELGASPKVTIASTSMSLFRNKYLKQDYFRQPTHELLEIFQGYYGGRTEAFARGTIEDYNYYDFNSLYPSVMKDNVFPNPNTKRVTHKNTDYYIHNYEGMSKIDIFCPYDTEYPLLPTRIENKLIFPTGNITGWYTHTEIRRAVELGYTIKKTYKTYYYLENCEPFKDFVEDLFSKRLRYKSENNPMQFVTKILMNSLYGKFGQKFLDKDSYVPEEQITIEKINKMQYVERVGNFFRVKKDIEPSCFCIPIWASYVTAYARIKLHSKILIARPVYVDTDSLITKKLFKDSIELGELKLEYEIKKAVIVKPKMYHMKYKNKSSTKVKGLGVRLCGAEFMLLLKERKKDYTKFVKFREALRRNLKPNQIIDITKVFNLEDNKRDWKNKKFNKKELQFSQPLSMDELTQSGKETASVGINISVPIS